MALPGGATRSLRVGRYPHDATASGERIFVGDERGGTVSVLDGERPAGRFRVAYQPGGVAILDSGRKLVVVSVKERVVELFDVRTLRRLGRAPAGVGPTHVVTDGHQMAYVVDTAGGALLAFHLQPRFELVAAAAAARRPVRHRLRPRVAAHVGDAHEDERGRRARLGQPAALPAQVPLGAPAEHRRGRRAQRARARDRQGRRRASASRPPPRSPRR